MRDSSQVIVNGLNSNNKGSVLDRIGPGRLLTRRGLFLIIQKWFTEREKEGD